MEIQTYALRFAGSKAELKLQLDKWCSENGKSFNGTVVDLIQKFLKNQNKQNEKTNQKN
jgi:hypothetical protein